jgi:hypothetical protein
MEKNIVTRERERKKDQATEREKVFRRLTAARERATKRKRDLVGLEVVRARDGSCDDGGSWPATRKNEEIEYTTAVKVNTSGPFSFLDFRSILLQQMVMLLLALLKCFFFFLHVQSKVVVHDFEEKCMPFFFEIPNFLQSYFVYLILESSFYFRFSGFFFLSFFVVVVVVVFK